MMQHLITRANQPVVKIGLRLLSLLALVSICLPTPGLVNGKEPDADDKRFDAVAAFSNTNWLIDNPGDNMAHNWFGGAVLIAPDVVLFAKHLLPAQNRDNIPKNLFMVRFRRHADGSLGSKDAGPDSYHQVPIARIIPSKTADLALGILAKPIEHIEPVKLHLDATEFSEQNAMLAGWGSESPWRGRPAPRNGLRIGPNLITAKGRTVSILSTKTEVREDNQGKRGAYYIDEHACPNMHDSGGSIFLVNNDQTLSLCGIIATYSGGSYLPAADTDDFPLKAAAQGGRALIKALENSERETPTTP